jgi:hypothetical protein
MSGGMISLSNLGYLRHMGRAQLRFSIRETLFYFRRRRPDRHGRTRDFAGTRRRVDADERPRLDVDRGYRSGLDDWRRLNVEGIWSRLDTGSAGRNCDWRRRPDIRLARRHVGPQWLVSRLRIELRVCARRYGPLRRAAPP